MDPVDRTQGERIADEDCGLRRARYDTYEFSGRQPRSSRHPYLAKVRAPPGVLRRAGRFPPFPPASEAILMQERVRGGDPRARCEMRLRDDLISRLRISFLLERQQANSWTGLIGCASLVKVKVIREQGIHLETWKRVAI